MPGRNDPCPCGSGLKYKKCCGAKKESPAARAAFPIKVTGQAQRQCGECTACCDGWLKITVNGHAAYPGKPCYYNKGHCCSIYEKRPQEPCRNFVCGWLEPGSPLPEEFRPDKLGVIFLRATWRGTPIYGLFPAGRDPDEALLAWTKQFSEATRRPFLYQAQGLWYAHGPKEFQTEMLAKISREGRFW